MKIFDINYLSESSICLIENEKIKFAISEERLNRKKNWYGNPFKSVKHCLNESKIKFSDKIIYQLMEHPHFRLNHQFKNKSIILQ